MTKIKLCGLSRPCDIEVANELKPDYIGFVFAEKSRRYVTPEKSAELKNLLHPSIKAMGVFVNERPEKVAQLLKSSCIDIAQLHGSENDGYISNLRAFTESPIIKAFKIRSSEDIADAEKCNADFILLDSGVGMGNVFDWNLIKSIKRPYFLAGGLGIGNVNDALRILSPYAVDVSSGIESDGYKDRNKMTAFVNAVRKEDKK